MCDYFSKIAIIAIPGVFFGVMLLNRQVSLLQTLFKSADEFFSDHPAKNEWDKLSEGDKLFCGGLMWQMRLVSHDLEQRRKKMKFLEDNLPSLPIEFKKLMSREKILFRTSWIMIGLSAVLILTADLIGGSQFCAGA